MKPLDKTKKYDLNKLSDEQSDELLNWLKENDKGWDDVTLSCFKRGLDNVVLVFNKGWTWDYGFENSTCATELFESVEDLHRKMLELMELGKQQGIKVVVTFDKL